MPITKQCPRCKKIIPYGDRYCDDCRPIMEADIVERYRRGNRKYNQRRNPKLQEFYHSKAWKRLRLARLVHAGYTCEYCRQAPAEDVHHEIPIDTPEGWDNRYNFNDLRAACIRCHNDAGECFPAKTP